MAVFPFSKIGTNIYGTNENVTLLTNTLSLNSFLQTIGNENVLLSCVDIFSANINQLSQPFRMKYSDANGDDKDLVLIPNVDSYQSQNSINGFPLGDFPLDEDTGIEYDILPNTTVKLTFRINEPAREDISNSKNLEKATGIAPLLKQVIKNIGIPEPGEKTGCSPKSFNIEKYLSEPEEATPKKIAVEFKEPEEIKKLTPKIQKTLKSKSKTSQKKPKKVVKINNDWLILIICLTTGSLLGKKSKEFLNFF